MPKTVRLPQGIRRIRDGVGRRSRPIRRVMTPRQFKETYVNEALGDRSASTYLEIGVRDGESFRTARAGRKVGVDPVRHPALAALRTGEEFYEVTSDRFFAQLADQVFRESRVDVALIDGLHEFRQALRDLLGACTRTASSSWTTATLGRPPGRGRPATAARGTVTSGRSPSTSGGSGPT